MCTTILLSIYRKLCYGGEYIDGKWHGEGKYVHRNGAYYEGKWVDGLKNGYGRFYYSNGAIYEGDWVNDQKQGSGVYRHPDGSMYKGQFYNDKLHGEGTLVLRNGDEYIGTFKEGLWCGGVVSKKSPRDKEVTKAVPINAFEITQDCFDLSNQYNEHQASPQEEYNIPLLNNVSR